MRFPSSAVIYPEKNRELPETLRCRIIFQDGSQHIYQVPTVRIQSYSMQEICDKHLLIFIPYVLLRLRPKLNPNRKNPLTEKELTDLVAELAEKEAERAKNEAKLVRLKEILDQHHIVLTP